MNTLEELKAIKELLSLRSAWTERCDARNISGISVVPESDEATCWCLYGAAYRIAGYDAYAGKVGKALRQASQELYNTPSAAGHVNDTLGFGAVHKVLDRAIENEEAKSKLETKSETKSETK